MTLFKGSSSQAQPRVLTPLSFHSHLLILACSHLEDPNPHSSMPAFKPQLRFNAKGAQALE